MRAQPSEPEFVDRRVAAIPRTISAIGDALTGAQRVRFFDEVLEAEQGVAIDAVMERWWVQSVLDQAFGSERSLAYAAARRDLIAIEDVAVELGLRL